MEVRLEELKREKKACSSSLICEGKHTSLVSRPTENHALEMAILEDRIKAIREALTIVPESYRTFVSVSYTHLDVYKRQEIHSAGKKAFIHVDFAEGIGKDRFGLEFLSKQGADGVLTTRTNIIKAAKEFNLITVQRFFMIDSHSVGTSIESIKISKPDIIEIMPVSYTHLKDEGDSRRIRRQRGCRH